MNEPADYLLRELSRVRLENRGLRREVRRLRESRTRWKLEARAWRWGAEHPRPRLSTVSTVLSPTGSAEES